MHKHLTRLMAAGLALAFVATPAPAQQPAPTTRDYVGTLASESLDGREAGTPGEQKAGEYIAAQLARLGAKPLPGRPDMFVQRRSLFFKKMQIVRGCDKKRNVLIYMVYSDRLIEGSPQNSTSSVPIMPWGANDQIQKCGDWVKD